MSHYACRQTSLSQLSAALLPPMTSAFPSPKPEHEFWYLPFISEELEVQARRFQSFMKANPPHWLLPHRLSIVNSVLLDLTSSPQNCSCPVHKQISLSQQLTEQDSNPQQCPCSTRPLQLLRMLGKESILQWVGYFQDQETELNFIFSLCTTKFLPPGF